MDREQVIEEALRAAEVEDYYRAACLLSWLSGRAAAPATMPACSQKASSGTRGTCRRRSATCTCTAG